MQHILSKSMFSDKTILKTVYLWRNDYAINIKEDENNYILEISSNNGCMFNIENFIKELQEQQLRDNLNAQFGSLRDSIYKRAFEHFER